jgi:hypothetical protein
MSAEGGCYCDSLCIDYDDCCSDAQAWCAAEIGVARRNLGAAERPAGSRTRATDSQRAKPTRPASRTRDNKDGERRQLVAARRAAHSRANSN